MSINPQIQWLVGVFKKPAKSFSDPEAEKIKLSQLASKLGFVYEKIRNVVDYNEEHLITRNSLKRLLNRQIILVQEKRSQKIAKTLVHEFIRAGYLPNNNLPETIIDRLAMVINKYLEIVSYIQTNHLPKADKLTNWAIDLAACEINTWLFETDQDTAMANFMYSHLVDNLTLVKTDIDDKEKNLQIYIATLKTLERSDAVALNYHLLKLYLPEWNNLTKDNIRPFCKNITIIKNKIEKHLKHPLGFQLTRTIRPQSVFFSVLRQLIEKNKGEIDQFINDQDKLEEKIEDIAIYNYQITRSKLIGTILRVIIYIFFTKTILAFLIELPFDWFILNHINWKVLAINVIFHPVLMFFIAMTIRVPGIKNTQIIVGEIKKIVYGEERKIIFKAKKTMHRNSFSYFAFNFVYLIMFALSFGLIIFGLNLLNFNILSGVLFVFFLTVVSFFGFRLRTLANQYSVIPRKDNLINFIFDFFSLPIIRVGRFLSTNFSKINILLFFMDVIVETPFKMLVEFFDKTLSFIHDKRDEIVE